MQVSSYLKLSVLVALATIVLKTGAWWLTGSVSLLSDAIESLVNLAGAGFALAMVTVASRPPDLAHPYGHHKAEYFSSGFEGALIFVAAAAIIASAVSRLLNPQPLEVLGWGLALSVVSSVLNGALAWAMLRKGREQRSMALEADARHLFTDVWTSAGVLLGLGAVQWTGWLWLDPAVALAVALNILHEGGRLLWRSVAGLMDEAVEAPLRASIDAVLQRHADERVRFDHLITRTAGQRCFVEVHMHLPGHWTLSRAASERAEVERSLMQAVPGLRASIQLLPSDVESSMDSRFS
jgi:cation diffusion facilitator family transporter